MCTGIARWRANKRTTLYRIVLQISRVPLPKPRRKTCQPFRVPSTKAASRRRRRHVFAILCLPSSCLCERSSRFLFRLQAPCNESLFLSNPRSFRPSSLTFSYSLLNSLIVVPHAPVSCNMAPNTNFCRSSDSNKKAYLALPK